MGSIPITSTYDGLMVFNGSMPVSKTGGLCSNRGRPANIGLWCNGNTPDSGSEIPGSSPGGPTKNMLFSLKIF